VNGEDAVKGRYPYFVTLQKYGAGALIAPDIVLSAGHCRYVTVCVVVVVVVVGLMAFFELQ
jgi:secreted trypsin-like serine protease